MRFGMLDLMLYFMYLLLAMLMLLVVAAIFAGHDAEKYRTEHHCVLIHSNPDVTRIEYNVPLKMAMPVTHHGDKFYRCDNDEWKVY